MNDCTACGLCRDALNTNIPGRGTGKVLVVGMNPGGQESMAGRVFVGPSGKLLAELLADAGFAPSEVRYTNAVRCEGAVTSKAIDACRSHLTAEIAEVQPTVIIALGDVALQSLCKKSGVSGKRGGTFPLHPCFGYACEVWPTYHPAYVLRVPQARDTVLADLRRVRDRSKNPDAIVWAWAQDKFPEGRILAWDIETIDESGEIVPEPTQIAVAGPKGAVVGTRANLIHFALELRRAEGFVVTHNGWRFDVPKLREATGVAVPWGEDTMVLAYLVDENQPLGLESLAVKYLRVPGWKTVKYARLGTDEFALYNARDAVYTRRLWAVLRQILGSRARIASEVILPALHALDAASARGVYIDPKAVATAHDEYTRRALEARARVEALAPGLSPHANMKVIAALAERGYVLRTADKVALRCIDDPLARSILAYRHAAKKLSTYIKPYALAGAGDGRVRPTYHLYRRDLGGSGTVVGRTSASGPNVQNLDRDLRFFAAPPGRALVKADYSAMHIRLAAWCAGEESVLDRFRDNPRWDPHQHFLEQSGLPITRQVAKSANFSMLYKGGPSTLLEFLAKVGTAIAPSDAERIYRAWHATFPAYRPWYARVEAELREHGYVENATGQRRHFGNVATLYGNAYEEAVRQAINFKVLSLEAHIAMLALGEAHRRGLEIVLFVHDSIAVECDAKDASRTAAVLEAAMATYPVVTLRDRFGVALDVPLVIDVSTQEG